MATQSCPPIKPKISIEVTLRLSVDADTSYQEAESMFGKKLDEVGALGLAQLIATYDTEGEPLCCDGETWTSKGQEKAVIQTVHGPIHLVRHVYQTSAGGRTRAPLDERLGLIGSATPELAKALASKCAEAAAPVVQRDMKDNHHRSFATTFIQDTAVRVSDLGQHAAPASRWEPLLEAYHKEHGTPVTIVVGVDGAMINSRNGAGWRQALAGSFTFYDKEQEYINTVYVAGGPGDTPVEGKRPFFDEMKATLKRLKELYPKALIRSISDAASDFKEWLREQTTDWLVDYHHATEYLSGASTAFAITDSNESGHQTAADWASAMRHTLRDEKDGAKKVLQTLAAQTILIEDITTVSESAKKGLQDAVTYFTNHGEHMDYADWTAAGLPIGSGPTEAACKTIIKARMTQAGMRWGMPSAHAIIWLRALYRTPARWEAFWIHHQEKTKKEAM